MNRSECLICAEPEIAGRGRRRRRLDPLLRNRLKRVTSWCSRPAASNADGGLGGADYGYQWWVTSAGKHPAFAAIGYGGQIIEVVPDLRLVVVASTWIDDTTGFDSRTWETMIPMVIVPAFQPDPD